jgi:hypothetical protein
LSERGIPEEEEGRKGIERRRWPTSLMRPIGRGKPNGYCHSIESVAEQGKILNRKRKEFRMEEGDLFITYC